MPTLTWPVPSHSGHVTPATRPLPPQRGQTVRPVPGVPSGASSPGLIGVPLGALPPGWSEAPGDVGVERGWSFMVFP
jgi:hypothetical protein